MRLLAIAADRMEFRGWLARAEDAEPARLPVDWARRVRFGGYEALLAANGVGVARAAAAVDAAVGDFRPEAVLSTGFCGALDPALGVADIVVAASVAGADGSFAAHQVTAKAAFHTGQIRTINHIARSASEKRELRVSGGLAVEMEAAGVAGRAQAYGLPFYCVRAVSDLSDENLANDFNAALRADGHFATMLILGNLLRHPSARLPELVRLRKRCMRASCALGDFLADCRF